MKTEVQKISDELDQAMGQFFGCWRIGPLPKMSSCKKIEILRAELLHAQRQGGGGEGVSLIDKPAADESDLTAADPDDPLNFLAPGM